MQLWRKISFSPKLRDKILNGEPGFEPILILSLSTYSYVLLFSFVFGEALELAYILLFGIPICLTLSCITNLDEKKIQAMTLLVGYIKNAHLGTEVYNVTTLLTAPTYFAHYPYLLATSYHAESST